MKKIFVLLVALIVILSGVFFAIKFTRKNQCEPSNFVSNFISESIINIGDKVYGCEVSRKDNVTKMILDSPQSVKGVEMLWENGKQKISFNGIGKNFNEIVIRENSFLNLVVKILDSIQSIPLSKVNSDGKYTTFKGKIDKNDFELTSDDSLYVRELKIPSKNSKISFDYKNN